MSGELVFLESLRLALDAMGHFFEVGDLQPLHLSARRVHRLVIQRRVHQLGGGARDLGVADTLVFAGGGGAGRWSVDGFT